MRPSLNYVGWKERKQVAADLKEVYRAATAGEAEQLPAAFAARWDSRYAPIAALWRRQWQQVIPFFALPVEIRKVIYTPNAVESLNMSLRKAPQCSLFCVNAVPACYRPSGIFFNSYAPDSWIIWPAATAVKGARSSARSS